MPEVFLLGAEASEDHARGAEEDQPLVAKRLKVPVKRGKNARARSSDRGPSPSKFGNLAGTLPPVPTSIEVPRRQTSIEAPRRPTSVEAQRRQRSPIPREVSFQELLHQFRDAEEKTFQKKHDAKRAASTGRNARPAPLSQDVLIQLEQMQRLVREMIKKVEDLEKRAEQAELHAGRAEEQLSEEARVRRDTEQLRAQAAGRVEELELRALKFQAEKEQWKQRESELQEHASRGQSMLHDLEVRDVSAIRSRDDRIEELESLLQQALVRGARIGKANVDIESEKAEIERKLSKVKVSTKARLRRERRRLEEIINSYALRAERAEDRLAEYLDASIQGADALAERHMRHLVEVCHDLAEKVDEQADIIDALRNLLHDHKDFIRSQLPESLFVPPPASTVTTTSHGVAATAANQAAKRPSIARCEPPALSALRNCTVQNEQPPDMDSVDLSIVSKQPGKKSIFQEILGSPLTNKSAVTPPPSARRLGLPPPPPTAPYLDDGSSTDSFDEEIFGSSKGGHNEDRKTRKAGDQALNEIMPSGQFFSEPVAAPARRRKADDDDAFDEEIFGSSKGRNKAGDQALHEIMPGGQTKPEVAAARARRRKADDDDEWLW